MARPTPFEIVKLTPKNNCGECGFPSCLAFGVAVTSRGHDLHLCPYLNRTGLNQDTPAHVIDSHTRDLELVCYLRRKVENLALETLAGPLGAQYYSLPMPTLVFRFLGKEARLTREVLLVNGTEPGETRDQILLYNYIFCGGGTAPTRDWIGMESLPNSISKIKTLKTYCEERLAGVFAVTETTRLTTVCRRMDGLIDEQDSADLAMTIPVLPRIPLKVLYWKASVEDGFAAAVKVLFDRHVLDVLDLESLVFCAERLAERFAEELDIS